MGGGRGDFLAIGWQQVIKLFALAIIGYGEYRLWTGTTSHTVRGLSVVFAGTLAWEVITMSHP